MLKYNKNTANTEKILHIQRAFTTSENSCDYEVDVLIKNPKKPDGTEYHGRSIANIVQQKEYFLKYQSFIRIFKSIKEKYF
jgi:hypothetical protein